jgi:hypothetical protein
MNEEEIKNKSLYQETFADSSEKDFALSQVESFCKSWGMSFEYDPVRNTLFIWQKQIIGMFESDVFTPEDIQEIWIDWCRNA